MTDDPLTECQECGAAVERVFHPVAVHYKGSGFYTTDYAKKGSKADGRRRRRRRARPKPELGLLQELESDSSKSDSSSSKSDSGSKPGRHQLGLSSR